MSQNNTRRNFMKKGLLGVVAGTAITSSPLPSIAKPSKEEDSFHLGFAGYTFVHFNLEDTLEMVNKLEVNYLCIKDFHLPLDANSDTIKAFHAQLAASNVTGYAVGPIYCRTREEMDRAFEYAKRVGVDLIVGIPLHEDLPYLDQKVKEYNIRFAIHNHGPEDKLYPNATVTVNLIKDLDKRIGLCFDMGHNIRDGHDPIADLKKYKDRIFDIHLKNVTAAAAEGKTCELGRGVIDIPAFVTMLRKVKYTGKVSLEYEKDMKTPLQGISESVGYYRGVVAALG
ncbi:sugar phosphate isomerase/epimerase family protein [Lunatimonas salinarum]|uniref:sugar phosphate isomerase/epimerase family protein n=1 Tax=Lunatimonas salinarum TaxID=1774590 RepID=UPI001ADF47D5|nr:sugar phosphate isomerase/epimerase family protein [Lunatimonas salinarum]